MKIFIILSGLIFITGCAGGRNSSQISSPHDKTQISSVSSAVDIDGLWKGKINNLPLTFNFKQNGDSFTGTVNGVPGQPVMPLKDGKIEGDNISFSVKAGSTSNVTKMKVNYKGSVEGDKIELIVRVVPGRTSSYDSMYNLTGSSNTLSQREKELRLANPYDESSKSYDQQKSVDEINKWKRSTQKIEAQNRWINTKDRSWYSSSNPVRFVIQRVK